MRKKVVIHHMNLHGYGGHIDWNVDDISIGKGIIADGVHLPTVITETEGKMCFPFGITKERYSEMLKAYRKDVYKKITLQRVSSVLLFTGLSIYLIEWLTGWYKWTGWKVSAINAFIYLIVEGVRIFKKNQKK